MAQVLPADGHEGFRVSVQLLHAVRDMDQRDHGEDHALVALGEIGQKFLGLSPELLQLVGHGGGEVVFVILPLLPSGDVRLDAQNLILYISNRFIGGNGQNVDGQHEAPGEVRQVGDHAVLDVAGVVFQE